jgi:hypothetical protein
MMQQPTLAVVPCNDTGLPSEVQAIHWVLAFAGMTHLVLDLDT